MLIAPETLAQVVGDVFATMTGFEPRLSDDPGVETGACTVAACIHLSGAFTGAVVVRAPESLARTLAAAMFATDPSALSDGEVMDAVGEIANMVAGAARQALPMPNALSLPSVSRGIGLRVDVPGSVPLSASTFLVDDTPFDVTLSVRSGGV